MARALITIPATAKRNTIIEIRALIQHPMETGYRRSSEGAMLARDLIRQIRILLSTRLPRRVAYLCLLGRATMDLCRPSVRC